MRINIEIKLFSDWRFETLVRQVGSKWAATGMLVDFWVAASKRWQEDASLLSYEQVVRQGFLPILEAGLAEKRGDEVYAKGMVQYFDWARRLHEMASKAGKASAASRLLKHGTSKPIKREPAVHEITNGHERDVHEFETKTHESYPQVNMVPCEPAVHEMTNGHERGVHKTRTLVNAPTPSPSPDFTNVKSPLYPPSGEEAAANEGSREDQEKHASPRRLAEMWNELRGEAQPKVDTQKFRATSRRWKTAARLLKEIPDFDYWQKVIAIIAASEFCKGANERRWIADFDFLIRSDTHAKAIEGKYGGIEKRREEVATTNESNLLDLSRRKVLDLAVFERYRK